MIPLYINSLYNMLVKNNALVLCWHQFCEAISMAIHYRRNMQLAQVKLHRMEHQMQTVENYINRTRNYNDSRFNITR